jgi:hypothetical protein
MKLRVMAIMFVTALTAGCVSHQKISALSRLDRLGKEQQEIERFLNAQAEGAAQLVRDILLGNIQTDISKEEVVTRYGEPIFCEPLEEGQGGEKCLYRRPTEYFNTDQAYLTFDKEGKLRSWKLEPKKER